MSIVNEVQRISQAKADLKTAIETKGVTIDESATIDTYASKVDDVYSAAYEKGKSEGGGGMTMANYASYIQFTSDDWATSDTVVLDVPNMSAMNSIFYNFDFLKIKHLTINSNTPVTNCQYAFRGGEGKSVLETIVLNIDTSKCTTFSQMVFKHNMKRVEGNPFDFSGATTIGRVFAYTYYVEHFRVVPNSIKINADFGHCTIIDDDTIQSIIEGLAELPSGTTQSLILHTKIVNRLTEEQTIKIYNKNWQIG